MMFIKRIKQLREELQMPQRKLTATMDIGTASYYKIEKGERCTKKNIPIIADFLQTDLEGLLTLWLADQATSVVANEKSFNKSVEYGK